MKISTSFRLILLIATILFSLTFARKSKSRTRNKKYGPFDNQELKNDPNKSQILTDEALGILLNDLGYSFYVAQQCIQSLPLRDKKRALTIITKVAEDLQFSHDHANTLLDIWTCPNVTLMQNLNNPTTRSILPGVVSKFTKKFRKMRKLRLRKMKKLRKMK